MSAQTGIQWCDSTFNPVIGCMKVGPGCDNCYAAQQDKFRHWTPEGWGGPRKRTSVANWKQPVKWNAAGYRMCTNCGWRGERTASFVDDGQGGVHICPDCSECSTVETRRRVFCASLADVFDNKWDPAWRRDLFDLIELTPNLDWLLLTKRIGNVPAMVRIAKHGTWLADQKNVWLGATVVNQEEADRDISKLLATPSRIRFLSMEPLLGPVDLTSIHISGHGHHEFDPKIMANVLQRPRQYPTLPQVNWVIAGGESGPGARPSHPDWYRSLRDQCAAAGVPFLFKQWGEWRPAVSLQEATNYPVIVSNRAVAGETAAIREHKTASGCYHLDHQVESLLDGKGEYAYLDCAMFKASKKSTGRLLDGIEHTGFPS